jgi:preprotein translocase subunit SecD
MAPWNVPTIRAGSPRTSFLRVLILLCIFSMGGCDLHEPIGVDLTYAVNKADANSKNLDMPKVLAAVRRRVRLYGTATPVGDRVKVGVYGAEKKNVEHVKKLIAQTGVLEFRVLADRRFDSKLIELAEEKQFADQRDVRKTPSGTSVGRWCPVDETESRRLTRDKNLVTREADAGRIDVLVAIDRYHVTGDDFIKVYPDTDQNGQPCVFFELSADGAQRMKQLTSENLPAGDDPAKMRLLGVIFDGKVQTAPLIRSEIRARGVITGKYSEQDATDLSVILSAGSLPVHLELVKESAVSNADGPASDKPVQPASPLE